MTGTALCTLCGIVVSAASVAVAADLPAAGDQPAINDVRVEAGRSPATWSVEGRSDFSTHAARVGVQYVRSFGPWRALGGPIAGVEAGATAAKRRTSADADVLILGLDGHVGWGCMLPDDWRAVNVEVTAFLGGGLGIVKGFGVNDSATELEYGLRGAAFWTASNRWQIGLDLRWLSGSFKPALGGVATKVSERGIVGMVVAGYRF